MIIEVALGVVLGVVILRYWPQILALGALAAVTAGLVAIGGGIIYWIVTNEPVYRKLASLSVVLVVVITGSLIAQMVAKRTLLTHGEAGVFLTMATILTAATLVFLRLISIWSADANEPLLHFFLVPIVSMWIWIWYKFAKLVRERAPVNQPNVTDTKLSP